MSQILLIESNLFVASFIQKSLRSHGFSTAIANNGEEGFQQLLQCGFDLLILELNLPDIDGLQVIQELRNQGKTVPIIILTIRDEIQDKVVGFESGADDYMTKPFHVEELLARVRVRIQQHNSRKNHISSIDLKQVVRVGDIELDLIARQVRLDNQLAELSVREFMLVEVFFQYPGQIFSREQLLDRVWGYDYNPGSNIVDVYVGYLRKKLGKDIIETVRGAGYRLRS
ncbi:MAG: response regulator transcription factor [Cyanobacteria bacterium J06636_16]